MIELGDNMELEKLHVFWSAKEALYKKFKNPHIFFKDHMYIHPFDLKSEGNLVATFSKDGLEKDIQLKYEIIGDFTLVYTSNP